jgi:aspartyl/asparaginyl beta-hydroxylase (cupin superfamily)
MASKQPHLWDPAWEKVVTVTTRLGDRLLRVIDRVIAKYSLIPNQPFFDPDDFSWVAPLEAEWKTIRRELDDVLSYQEALPNFQDISIDQLSLTDDDRWKTYFFYGYGFKSEPNCARCPETARIVERIPGMQTAMFSILAPHKHLPPHTGPYKGVLRYHLGLVIPASDERVGIKVGGQTAHWHEGKSLVFDDTFEHEAWNDTDDTRVVLFVDVVRPLRQPVKAFNDFMIKAIGYSPFIQDARKRHEDWERRFEKLRAGN